MRCCFSALTLALGIPSTLACAQGAFDVLAMSPAPHATAVANAAPIALTFNAPVLASSITASVARVAGRWSGSVPGSWTLDPSGTVLRFAPARPFFAGEQVQVMLSRDLRSSGGASLAGGFAASIYAGVLPTPFGPLSLATPPPLFVLASGALDGFGEQRVPLPVPLGLASGAELAFQGLVLVGAQPQLTNPELARVR